MGLSGEREGQPGTTREKASSSAGARATNKALQLTLSSSAACTRATTIDYSSSAFQERAAIT